MHHERVSENVYWFQSEIYAQVTAGVVAGPQWAIVIDTLALPEETLAIRDFVEHEVGIQVRYVINTHYHADHTWGNCFFPGATIISHSLCRQLLEQRAIPALETARKQNSAFRQVKIVLPHITFDQGVLTLRVGKKNLTIMPAPGHSADGIAVLIEEDRVLFAGDAFMPLPYVVDGDADEMAATIKKIGRMGLENIIQGHGDIILRGEIEAAVRENLNYLDENNVESSGKSRVNLSGLAEELHRRNLRALLRQEQAAAEAAKKK